MVHVFVSHEVQDFNTWKQHFDADSMRRAETGIKTTGIYTALDNPNNVTATFEIPSLEVLQAFMGNPELKVIMEKAGVTTEPVVQVMQKSN